MTEEQLEKARPYLAGDELKARYPDVDFDPQGANPPRLDYVSDVVRLHGRDQAFLLALVFSGKDSIDCCKILRRVIKDFRHYIVASYRAGVPFEEVEVVNVDELRRIVYKVFPETNTMDMYIKLLNDNEALAAEIAALREEVAVLKELPVEGRGSASNKAKGRSSASTNKGSENPEEESQPVTMGEVNEYYSDRAKAAVKALKPRLMRELSLAFASQEDCSRFIDGVPAPKNTEELVNQLFKPFCESGAMLAEVAVEIRWGDKIYDLTDFDPQVQPRQITRLTKSYLESFLAAQKAKAKKA